MEDLRHNQIPLRWLTFENKSNELEYKDGKMRSPFTLNALHLLKHSRRICLITSLKDGDCVCH